MSMVKTTMNTIMLTSMANTIIPILTNMETILMITDMTATMGAVIPIPPTP